MCQGQMYLSDLTGLLGVGGAEGEWGKGPEKEGHPEHLHARQPQEIPSSDCVGYQILHQQVQEITLEIMAHSSSLSLYEGESHWLSYVLRQELASKGYLKIVGCICYICGDP